MNMQVYLPISEVAVNAFVLLGLGGLVGVLSGMFGVGGGFLLTPRRLRPQSWLLRPQDGSA